MDRLTADQKFGLLRKLLRGAFVLCTVMVLALVMGRHLEALWAWAEDDVLKRVPALAIGAVVVTVALAVVLLFRRQRAADPTRQLYLRAAIAITHVIVGTIVLGSLLTLTQGSWESQGSWGVISLFKRSLKDFAGTSSS